MRDKQKEETRKRLYHASLEIFARDGFQSCRIEDIAQIAQVSRAAFYFHFPSKEDVLLELLRETELQIAGEIEALPPAANLKELLQATIAIMTRAWNEPRRQKLATDIFAVSLRRNSLTPEPDAHVVRAMLAPRFQAVADRGELSNTMPAEMLCDFFLLNSLAVLASWGANASSSLGDQLRAMTLLFMNGARPAHAPAFTLDA